MRNLIFLAFVLLFWSCEMQSFEELAIEPETIEQLTGPYQVTSVSKTTIQSLGKKLEKRIGFNVIESAQMRQISDFTFDLEASLVNSDTVKRKTYTVPFLEKGDKYSIFNLVIVADSADNVLEQYVLQYEFDGAQYQAFEQTQDILASGVTIKRFPFSSFFNDSNPGFLERCDGIFDSNGDPVTCDEVTLNFGGFNGGGGSSGGNIATIPAGGGDSGPCIWGVSWSKCTCDGGHTHQCGCPGQYQIVTINCGSAMMRKAYDRPQSSMMCMDCSASDFGAPAFTLTRHATQIDNLLTDFNLTDWHMAYLSLNSTFSSSFRSALFNDPNLDQDAAMFTLSAGMNGALSGNFNSTFILSVEGLMEESEADLTQEPFRILFQSYFSSKYLILKYQNPSWSQEKLFYETAKEAIHLTLDAIGMIEGLGTPADLFNAGLYYLEGDNLNGNLSLVAATPVIGLFSTTIKGAIRLKGIIPGTTRRITHVWVKNGNKILFGGTNLRKVMGLTDPTKHAHHILPLEHSNHPVIQKAAQLKENPFHMDELNNDIAVPSLQNTNHPAYNQRVFAVLENYNLTNPNATPEQAYLFLNQEIAKIRSKIELLPPGGKINDVIWK
ncbi:AHH domain-containing protein [Algoriphagus litoralis]|uniref:AHH domain-containing protein n=1 Tax=Algoriphagus litoralis TaxID=2202829 RepID=UPI000DB988CB|nr:AHH domain-containing protein [Algoriphagus litoralis]